MCIFKEPLSIVEFCTLSYPVRLCKLQINASISFLQNEENEQKRQQELEKQRVASQMAELKTAKLELEQEVDVQRKRLRIHMETQVRIFD